MSKLPVSSHGRQSCMQVAENPGSVLREKVSDEEVYSMYREYRPTSRKRVFTALVTLWTFIGQMLNSDKTLKAAVARTMASRGIVGKRRRSKDASGYCKARYRFPIEVLINLVGLVAQRLERLATKPYLWHDRHVTLIDGSSASMPDTAENRRAFPQPPTQKKGCGFPVARIVGAFSLSTGALLDLAIGKLAEGELTLWRLVWKILKPGDIAVADRLFGQFADICLLQARGVDLVARIDKTRKVDFRRGQRLGPNDHLVTWTKPEKRSTRLSAQEWDALPAEITLREVRYTLRVRGFRSRQVVLVTTLLDHELYTVKELAGLYGRRWEVETDFDHLKTSMQMNVLGGKKPQMIVKELWTFMLAYNLIRTLMAEAAKRRHLNPLSISLMGAVQEVLALWPYAAVMPKEQAAVVYEQLLFAIGNHKIPKRPGRHEPRVLKRRHKDFDYMTRPRQAFRAEAVVMA